MDDGRLYPIGDVARRTGLSVSAIRFYADAGVIAPSGHTAGGHRLYDIDAVARLELVRTLRELGAGLDGIRRVLADETTLRDLAAAHLELVERQTRSLVARRAVLRSVVRSANPREQVSLMHRLVTMSDDDRERLIDEFWDEVTDGLGISGEMLGRLREQRPVLSEDPTAEQLEAWIELADLLRDDGFRREARDELRERYKPGNPMLEPAMVASIFRRAEVTEQARAAFESGAAADSAEARELADRWVALSVRDDKPDTPDFRRELAGHLRTMIELMGKRTPSPRFSATYGRLHWLIGTVNGTPRDPSEFPTAHYRWLASALELS